MKATREQCLKMAAAECRERIGLDWVLTSAQIERLVHLAQQFTLDQLRAKGGAMWIDRENLELAKPYATCMTKVHNCWQPKSVPLYRIPEKLE